jgi:hypothetical protein
MNPYPKRLAIDARRAGRLLARWSRIAFSPDFRGWVEPDRRAVKVLELLERPVFRSQSNIPTAKSPLNSYGRL